MNKIITSYVVDPSIQQPLTAPSLEFLQNSTKEMILGLSRSIVGDNYSSATTYVLQGLQTYGTNQYTDGYILYSGETYYCLGKTSTTAFSATPVINFSFTDDSVADPLVFSDGIARNVHNVRAMVLTDLPTGTGLIDLTGCTFVQENEWVSFTPTFKGYDSSDSEVVGGVSGLSSNLGWYNSDSKRNIRDYQIQVSGLAVAPTVRYIAIGIQGLSIPTGHSAKGTGAVFFQLTGNGRLATVAHISLSSTGQGDGLTIDRLDGADFGTITGASFRLGITIGII